jgi:hypothetical protein
MNESYEYLRLRIRPRAWPAVIEAARSKGAQAVAAGGGLLVGLFTGQIGVASDEGLALVAWPAAARAGGPPAPLLDGCADVREVRRERLVATVRPTRPAALTRPGVYAHRWFEFREADWPEFLELSEGAWPAFERAYDAEIQGFFRSLDVEPPRARVLLLTRYASLAEWSRSREAIDDATRESARRFRRRHELTESTVVVTTELRSA